MTPPLPPEISTPGTNTKRLKVAHQDMLYGVEVAYPRDTTLAASSDIFTFLDPRTGTSLRSSLKGLATLPLADSQLLVVCVETPELHIKSSGGVEYIIFSFLCSPTPKDGKVLAFTRDVWQEKLPTTNKVNPEWFQVSPKDTPPLKELTQVLAWKVLGTPRIPEQTETSDSINVPWASIYPLNLIHPLLRSPLLYPTSSCHLLLERAFTLHLEKQVQMFLDCLRGQTKDPANMINALTRIDIADATLKTLQELLKSLNPPLSKPQDQYQP